MDKETTEGTMEKLRRVVDDIVLGECFKDPELCRRYLIIKVIMRFIMQGRIGKSITKIDADISSMTAQQFDDYIEEFQKENNIDIIGEMEGFVASLTDIIRDRGTRPEAAEELLRNLITGA
jgi:hypothetical protein